MFNVLLAAVSLAPVHSHVQSHLRPFSAVRCETHVLEVDLGAGAVAIAGELCRNRFNPGTTVQVVTHGSTYDRRYWTTSHLGSSASYARTMAALGQSVFAYDRLGSGQSTHLASTDVTVAAHVQVLHAVVGALRQGEIGGTSYETVVSAGHSLGAIVALVEAAYFADVDGLVLSGLTHGPSQDAQLEFFDTLYPANFEPAFAGLDEGYLTTLPGVRGELFYAPWVSASAVAHDEATKGIITMGEIMGGEFADPSGYVTCPVLVVAGQQDPFACSNTACQSAATLEAQEQAFFTASPEVDSLVLPQTGHAVNAHHPLATLSFLYVWNWVEDLD